MDQDAKELASMERRNEKAKVKGATDRRMSHEAYVRNMQRYLRDGDWIDLFYGEHQEKKIDTYVEDKRIIGQVQRRVIQSLMLELTTRY